MLQEMGEPVAGSLADAPAGTDQLDLEAAEQLIQLSGGDDGGSESRTSADSVKCRGKEKEKEAAAVESRRRRAGRSAAAAGVKDDGDRGEACGKGAESFTCSTATGVEGKEKDKTVVVESRRGAPIGVPRGRTSTAASFMGRGRRRPKFRSLAAIYRETEARRLTLAGGGGGEGQADRDPRRARGGRRISKERPAM